MSQPMNGIGDQGPILLLATEEKIYSFDLWKTFRIAIGRHESNDIPLGSQKVSNFHAEILNEGAEVFIQDLRSTNGTYLNDQRARRGKLRSGDRIRIGSHELIVNIKSDELEKTSRRRPFTIGTSGRLGAFQPGATIRGPKDDPSLADLLITLSRDKSSVALSVTKQDEQACVYVDSGRIVHAEAGRARGEKALYRLFEWEQATFEVVELPSNVPHSIELPTDTLITEGVEQLDGMRLISAKFPPLGVELQLREDCSLPLSSFSPAEIEVFQSIIRYQTIQQILDNSPLTDFRILNLIFTLLQKKVFSISESADGMLEQTSVMIPGRS